MSEQRVNNIVEAADTDDGYAHIYLKSGAILKSRSVIISTGARWREMNVPGEQEYRNKGVAYCPHCDGADYSKASVLLLSVVVTLVLKRQLI